MKLRPLFAASALLSLLATAAHATVLVYEGFHPADYGNVSASGNVTASANTFPAGHTTGVKAEKWAAQNGSQIKVFGSNYGLELPQAMTDAAFTAIGGSIGLNPSENNAALRAMYHNLVSQTLNVSSRTLYFRMLLNIDSVAAGKLVKKAAPSNADGGYFGCGFCTGSGVYVLTANKASLAFVIWKNNDSQYVLSLTHTTAAGTTLSSYPLVTDITLGSTYVCYAEVQIDMGANGEEVIRAGAVNANDFTGAAPWAMINGSSDSVVVDLFSASSYPTAMAVAGPYGTNGGRFRADEIVVGTALGDILPIGGVFAVSPSGVPTVGTNSFSTAWILVADEGVTADAGLVWSTDETFATATTNSLGTGLAAGTRTASLTGLEPDTTYWWKIYADNGTAVAETSVGSFTTTGAPVLGTTTATVTGESAAFTVALEEAALVNTLATSVSVFYGTDGSTWTELPLGSASTATNLSGTADSLGYGVTYQWFARATATMEGGRILSAATATNSFTTLWNGDMYVDDAAANATKPYSTPATAAKTIADAFAIATDGATIHVAPGLYKISTPINITKPIRILGEGDDPARVVISNTVKANHQSGGQRIFTLNNADAVVANLTMQNGSVWGDWAVGGNFLISSGGGTVSNCIVEAGFQVSGHGGGGGGHLEAGVVTHTVFRGNYVAASTKEGKNKAGVLLLKGASRAENCLLVENPQSSAAVLVKIEGTFLLRNCTIVDSRLNSTNQYCTVFSPLHIGSTTASAVNVVVAGVTDKDGTACKPTGTRANFRNGALDVSIDGTTFPADTIVGTGDAFFKNYENGDYRPKNGGPLVNAGANYEGMAAVDLSGVQRRRIGKRVDIGAYEADATSTYILVK